MTVRRKPLDGAVD